MKHSGIGRALAALTTVMVIAGACSSGATSAPPTAASLAEGASRLSHTCPIEEPAPAPPGIISHGPTMPGAAVPRTMNVCKLSEVPT